MSNYLDGINYALQTIETKLDDQLEKIFKKIILDPNRKAIEITNSLDPNQLDQLVKLLQEQSSKHHLQISWFYPISKIYLSKFDEDNHTVDRDDVNHQVRTLGPVKSHLQILLQLTIVFREHLNRFQFIKMKKLSRGQAHFRTNHNLFTYFDSKPIVPKFKIIFPSSPSMMISNNGDDCIRAMSDKNHHEFVRNGQLFEPLMNFFDDFFAIRSRIKLIKGLSKHEKLALVFKINNQCSLNDQACRIVYLQSLSIMTFWMALKADEMVGDKWSSIGYQITLESKISLNNSIIFFEISTFIRVLNRDLNMNMISHLIIDVDVDEDNLFFDLLFLYLREHLNHLQHLNIIILVHGSQQIQQMSDYFGSSIIAIDADLLSRLRDNQMNNLEYYYDNDWDDNHSEEQETSSSTLGNIQQIKNSTDESSLIGAQHSPLVKIIEYLMFESSQNPCVLEKLIEFLHQYPHLINHQSVRLNGLTALIIATIRGSSSQLYRLLRLGANHHLIAWPNQMKPIEWAIRFRQKENFQLLFLHQYIQDQAFDLNHYGFSIQREHHRQKSSQSLHSISDQALSASASNEIENSFKIILKLLTKLIPKIYYENFDKNYWGSRIFDQHYDQSLIERKTDRIGSILILLKSYQEVSNLRKIILQRMNQFNYEFTIFCLYQNLPNNELIDGIRILRSIRDKPRIILSTLSVDCILFRGIRFIINTGLTLRKVHTPFSAINLFRSLSNELETVEIKSLLQKQNNRVTVFNLFENRCGSKQNLDDFLLENSSTNPLYHCILAVKFLQFKIDHNNTVEVFDKMLNHPRKDVLLNAISYLQNINVLDEQENLTELGKILIDLSIEPHYAKMIIFAVILRCLDPILTIVCSLSSPNHEQIYSRISMDISNSNNSDEINGEININRWNNSHKYSSSSSWAMLHKNYSDHLVYVYAFQRWQEMCLSSSSSSSQSPSSLEPKFNEKTSSVPPLQSLGSREIYASFEMIYSLRTKILAQLRAIGYVKGKGFMNIRYLNANSENFSLVKAVICAGQPFDFFANITDTMQCDDDLYQIKKRIFIDPSSILNRKNSEEKFPTNLLMFNQKITCGQISYLRDCTILNPITMALFSDESISSSSRLMNRWMMELNGRYLLIGDEMEKICALRQRWQYFVRKRLSNMQQSISEEDERFLTDLIRLVEIADESIGIGSYAANIGRAPQVMSIYFCQTVSNKK